MTYQKRTKTDQGYIVSTIYRQCSSMHPTMYYETMVFDNSGQRFPHILEQEESGYQEGAELNHKLLVKKYSQDG